MKPMNTVRRVQELFCKERKNSKDADVLRAHVPFFFLREARRSILSVRRRRPGWCSLRQGPAKRDQQGHYSRVLKY